MSEMVERVAEALWDLYQSQSYTRHALNELIFGGQWYGKVVPWSHLLSKDVVPSAAEEYRDKARAAIAAMREDDLVALLARHPNGR